VSLWACATALPHLARFDGGSGGGGGDEDDEDGDVYVVFCCV